MRDDILVKQRVSEVGLSLLARVRAEFPNLKAYSVEKLWREQHSIEFSYEVRSRRTRGPLGFLFPATLVEVQGSYGSFSRNFAVTVMDSAVWESACRQAASHSVRAEKSRKLRDAELARA
ncbi:MAG: hypothetical protein A2Z42_01855 [Candidatus Woykebacteria bacterium RBG_19FT_COMBO_43_10]|uniref:Uncharacterized protein n=1 Tax=Candidatus Woykebacteria bacterium RBG_19FT_COMBO_43_10 TaxID=1802598 RepID=A0A1G1WLK7_9BACT|nr:MAG: hypothetical protein A2Z42_01855 [Candidatus Woykebacteria bacterium RBG_19FT_COMBO_43_10]